MVPRRAQEAVVMLFVLQLPVLLHVIFGATADALAFTHEGWRIAMSIGREPGTGMPADWAASGCRLPVVVKCDFRRGGDEGNDAGKNVVVPLTNEVRFTGPDGEVVRTVEGGTWGLADARALSFTLAFPEELVRRDVTLRGTVRLTGLLYADDELRAMTARYKVARDAAVDAGDAFDAVARRREAPKKWNEEDRRWEDRYEDEGVLSGLGKQAKALFAERKERKVNDERPLLKDLSLGCGPFPGVDGDVYFKKEGKVMLKRGFLRECLIGTWYAEPINDKPLSYY